MNLESADFWSGFKYVLVPGSTALRPGNVGDYNNQIFRFWHSFWRGFFEKSGTLDHFKVENFFRHSVVAGLFHEGKAIGVHCYSFFDLEQEAIRKLDYFEFYPDSFFDDMKAKGVRHIMTLEYFAIDSAWRKTSGAPHIAPVLVNLGVQIGIQHQVDGIISIARVDRKTNDICYETGIHPYLSGLEMHGCPVEIIVGVASDLRISSRKEIQTGVNALWDRRIDPAGLTAIRQRLRQVA